MDWRNRKYYCVSFDYYSRNMRLDILKSVGNVKIHTSSKQWTVESTGYPYVEYGVLAWMPLPEPFVTDTNVGNKKGAER